MEIRFRPVDRDYSVDRSKFILVARSTDRVHKIGRGLTLEGTGSCESERVLVPAVRRSLYLKK